MEHVQVAATHGRSLAQFDGRAGPAVASVDDVVVVVVVVDDAVAPQFERGVRVDVVVVVHHGLQLVGHRAAATARHCPTTGSSCSCNGNPTETLFRQWCWSSSGFPKVALFLLWTVG